MPRKVIDIQLFDPIGRDSHALHGWSTCLVCGTPFIHSLSDKLAGPTAYKQAGTRSTT